MSESVTVRIEGRIAVLTLNRPAAFNAFDLDMVSAFSSALVTLASDANVRGIVISGEGKAFCAGGDLKWALASAIDMARELSATSLHSLGLSKRLLMDSYDTPFETHIERERAALSGCAAHPEGQEGLKAFSEKRKPKFAP